MSRLSWRSGALALLMGVVVTAAFYGTRQQKKPVRQIACDPMRTCTFSVRGDPYTLRFSPPPKPLQPFSVIVTGPQKPASVSFEMVGMHMGENRFSFQPQSQGIWKADALLPVCVTGRSDWRATLRFDDTAFEITFSLSR